MSRLQASPSPACLPNKVAGLIILVVVALCMHKRARLSVLSQWELGAALAFTCGENKCGSY